MSRDIHQSENYYSEPVKSVLHIVPEKMVSILHNLILNSRFQYGVTRIICLLTEILKYVTWTRNSITPSHVSLWLNLILVCLLTVRINNHHCLSTLIIMEWFNYPWASCWHFILQNNFQDKICINYFILMSCMV